MKQIWRAAAPLLAVALFLTGCGTKLYLKSYTIEAPAGSYSRLRIGVPTAGAGAGRTFAVGGSRYNTGSLTVIDPQNILVIIQNEVIRNLQGSGHHIALVDHDADLDLQIAFQPPSRIIDPVSLLTLGFVKSFSSLGGAKAVDAKTGKVLFTYEFVSTVRSIVPPSRIQDWETFAKALAAEINKTLETLKLADGRPIHLNITSG